MSEDRGHPGEMRSAVVNEFHRAGRTASGPEGPTPRWEGRDLDSGKITPQKLPTRNKNGHIRKLFPLL